jgi:DME family drug/metabolite transporter
VLYIAAAATSWGTGGAVAAMIYSASGLSSLTVSFWRFFGGALALGLVWPLLRGPNAISLVRRLRMAPMRLTSIGTGMAISQTAYFASVGSAGVAVATAVTLGAAPILVALGARLWMAERLGRGGAVAITSAVLGLVLLVFGSEPAAGSGARQPLVGIGLALLSAVAYAASTLLSRGMGTDEVGKDPIGNALISFTAGALCLLPLAPTSGLLPEHGDTATVVALLAYLGLIPSALAYGLFFAGLRVVTATAASVIALIEPLTAAAIAVWLLGEKVTVPAVLGGATLFAAVVALSISERTTSTEAVPISAGAHPVGGPGSGQ